MKGEMGEISCFNQLAQRGENFGAVSQSSREQVMIDRDVERRNVRDRTLLVGLACLLRIFVNIRYLHGQRRLLLPTTG